MEVNAVTTGRPTHEFYTFIRNALNQYYHVVYNSFGVGSIVLSQDPIPVANAANIESMQITFGTNKTYFSGVRSVSNIWHLILDAAEVIRDVKYNGAGYKEELYYLIIRYDNSVGYYRKYYEGRFDLKEAKDNPITGYNCPCVDTSIWGILSQNDGVQYQIDCTPQNPKTIPVLFDGVTLKARYTYQPVSTAFKLHNDEGVLFDHPIDLVQVNSDGDSSGVITKSQNYVPNGGDRYSNDNYIYRSIKNSTIRLFGEYNYRAKTEQPGEVGIELFLRTSLNLKRLVLGTNYFHINENYIYQYIRFDVTIQLVEGEWIEFIMGGTKSTEAAGEHDWVILPDVTNIFLEAKTEADASIVYCMRPLDVLQELVERATEGKYVVNSDFFTLNNRIVLTCGNALRNAPNAYLRASFEQWFKSYDIEYWIAFKVVKNQLWIEPAQDIYNSLTNLFALGEVSEIEIEDAKEYFFNEVEVNSRSQDYRHSSGRLEFNAFNTFSVSQFNIKNTLNLVSPFRKDCYGMEFIRLDYQQQSTKDNQGDTEVFMVDISDTLGTTGVPIENFVNLEVSNTPLAPIIYYPFNNDTITNKKPTVRGVLTPSTLFNVYVDGIFDGSATSDSTPYGNFTYNIQNELSEFEQDINSGVHTIELSLTDLTGTMSTVSVTIIAGTTDAKIAYPAHNQSIYDNKPMIQGFLQAGVIGYIDIDGVVIGTVVGDGNCRFEIKSPIMSNGNHLIGINGLKNLVHVNSFVAIPLITSFKDGFTIVNNLPLVEGVAKPGTKVNLYLDYYEAVSIGTTTSNSTGNWAVQLVPLFKDDGVIVLTPIPNGSHIISTDLEIKSTDVNIQGYLLNRPPYENITGVLDNTVFNTELTPKHNLLKRMNFFKSVFYQAPNTVIKFETGDKNQEFSTTLNGITTKENDDVVIGNYADAALFLPYILNCKVRTPFYFVDIIDNFNQGGLVEVEYQGLTLYCLPIGTMVVEDVTRDIQKWSLLISATTPLLSLLTLSTPGENFTYMNNAIFRSDYNTLHFVKYNSAGLKKYNYQQEVNEDWFANRNSRWINNPPYIYKWQKSDLVTDQIVTNGVGGTLMLSLFDALAGRSIAQFNYAVVSPAPIPFPDVVQETRLDLSIYPDSEYYFVMYANGLPIAISEKILLRDEFEDTVLVEAYHTYNKTGAIFSNGFKSTIRVEGLMQKWQPNLDSLVNEDDAGDFDLLNSVVTKKRTFLFGDGRGIPDYLYLKIAAALALDRLYIQGYQYVIDKDSRLEPADRLAGYPAYHYTVDLRAKENMIGSTFDAQQGTFRNGVTLVVDAGAFGMGGGGFTLIDLTGLPPIPMHKINSWDLGITVPSGNVEASIDVKFPVSLTINWGDGTIDSIVDKALTTIKHTYVLAGDYTISIEGVVEGGGYVKARLLTSLLKTTSVIDAEFQDFSSVFENCINLTSVPSDLFKKCPNANTMASAFRATGLTSVPVELFSYSPLVTLFSNLFIGCAGLTGSIPAGLFDNNTLVTTFSAVFSGCVNLTGSIPAGLFKNSKAIASFSSAFLNCNKLTGSIPADLFDASLSSNTGMVSVFNGCTLLTGSIPSTLFDNIPNAAGFSNTFNGCSGLTGSIPADLFKSKPIANSFSLTFGNCSGLTGSIPAGLFDGCPSMGNSGNLFQNCSGLTGIVPAGLFKNKTLSTISSNTFNGCTGLTGLGAGIWEGCSSVTTFQQIFYNCTGLVGSVPGDTFKGCSAATNMQQLFTNAPLSGTLHPDLFKDCVNVTNLSSAFYGSTGIGGALPVDLLVNCTKLTTLASSFRGTAITSIPSGFLDVCTEVTTFSSCFNACTALVSMPPDLFKNCNKVTLYTSCFNGCSNLVGPIGSALVNLTAPTTNFASFLLNCTKLTGTAPTLWLSYPALTGAAINACFRTCTLLTNYASIPTGWK